MRVIQAIILSRPEVKKQLYTDYVKVFISRFNEREENVKLDIFSTFSTMMRACLISTAEIESQEMDLSIPQLV